MKKMSLLILLAMVMLIGTTDCDNQVADLRENPGKYKEAGKGVINQVKGVDLEGKSGLEKTKEIVDTAAGVATTVNFIPGAQEITAPLVAGLTAISAILGWLTVRKAKQIRVEQAKTQKAEAIADDYGDALEAGIMFGEDQKVADMSIMATVMDTQTKQHFNAKGAVSL